MKYIDAEKLKSIIKVQIKERKEWMKDIDRSDRQDQLWSDLNEEDRIILHTITSLQQEQPSMSSNLDEAAEEYADYNSQRWHEGGDVYYDHSKIMDAFKAGAEWMAWQFQKIEGDLVDWYSTSNGKDYCCGIKTDESFEVPEGFYIRKK